MPNVNINGRTVDPNSIRQIPVPEGESPASYLKKNEHQIRHNFKDELYFESKGELFVTEDKFVIENSGLGKLSEAKVRMGAVPAVPLMIDNEPNSHKIQELTISGASEHKAWLEKELDLDKGDRINLHDLQKKANQLFKSNKFLSVNFVPTAAEKGINLKLEVQEVPSKIQFEGLRSQQAAVLEKLFPKPLTEDNIEKGLQAVQAAFDKNDQALLKGLQPQIHGNTLSIGVSEVTVPKELTFVGMDFNTAQTAQTFFQRPLNFENLEAGIDKLRKHYNDQGYTLPQLDFQVNGDEVTVQMSKTPMPTKMAFSGVTVYPEAEVKALFKSPLNMENIDKGLRALQAKYQEDGYVLMPPEGVSADLNKGVLTVNVREAKLGDVEFTGNDKTKENVLTRELRQKAGQPLNLKTLDKDLGRVAGTGLFANVQKTIEPDAENPDKVNVKVHVSEEKTSSFNIGAGYSASNGPFGTASLSLGNVGGQNRKLSIDGTLGLKTWGGGISMYDPQIDDKRTSLGGSLYHRQWKGPYSDEIRTGAKVTVGRPIGDKYESPWRMDITLDGQRIGIDDQFSVSGNGVDYRASVRPTLSYNTLDNRVLPHQGTEWATSAEPVWVSGRTLGKFDTKVNHYMPMGERVTFNAGIQGGTILGDAPLYEKFHNAGSDNTLMGWDSNGSVVGSHKLIAKAGARVDVWGPLSLSAQLTAGNISDDPSKLISEPKVGGGIGANLKLGSFGVLHAGYGMKFVGKQEGESSGAFHIGFGKSF